MTDKEKRRFYIGGRYYSPDEATPLCSSKGIFETVTLYKSPQGAFFTVSESVIDGEAEKAELLTENAARSFMDKNAAAVIPENYNKVFEAIEQG